MLVNNFTFCPQAFNFAATKKMNNMNKSLLSLLAVLLCTVAFGQKDYRKNPAIGVNFTLFDFKTANELRTVGLSNVIRSNNFTNTNRMAIGLGITYLEGLGNHIDFAGSLNGAFLKYPFRNGTTGSGDDLLLEATGMANLKLLTDKYWVTPYLSAGVGASKYKGYFGAFIPAGVGLQLNILDEAYLMINSQYRIPVTENVNYHLFHSIGLAGNVFKRKTQAPPPPPPPPPTIEKPKDRDNDGIIDAEDACPDVKGMAAFKGCPDTDGDGLPDGDDSCPTVAGTAKYKGCPVPDTDGDGINDEQDKCITTAGVARYQGCPVPDTDGDGLNDEEDKCIDKAGPASNSGCPEIAKAVVDKINYAAKNVFFATGSAKLLPQSFKPLNEVAKILAADESLKLAIDGHTDNTGKADKNQALSQSRADAVMAYLKSKGVTEDRMTATGYGQDQPVADNKTPAGRAKNRRVEMKATNY
jgi:OmpA-OmpF porin, OOP family